MLLLFEVVKWTSTKYTDSFFFSFPPAVGLETQIHIQAPGADGVLVECDSAGWFPEPQMEWRDSRGKALPPSSKSYSQDEARFFHLKTTLLTNRSQGGILCWISNPLTGEEKQISVILASEYCCSVWQLIWKHKYKNMELINISKAYYIMEFPLGFSKTNCQVLWWEYLKASEQGHILQLYWHLILFHWA